MISLTKVEPPILNPRPTVLSAEVGGQNRPWDQPDIRRNPKFWLKLYLEGLTLHRRSLALAGRADNILDLGCGSGWFSVELAKKRSDVNIHAVDTDGRLLDWGRYYLERRANEGQAVGRVRFSQTDVEEFPWDDYEEQFDLVHAGFILSRLKNPADALNGIYKCLKPGGWLIYHDCTDPPSRNLNRLARFQHTVEKWKNMSSDPWSWRRVWERRYQLDVIRAKSASSELAEKDLVRRLEELFAMRFHERRRAFLDMYLTTLTKTSMGRRALLVPLVKLCDDALVRTDMLVGATRYVLAQKR